ncbi:MAG: hypothetical protein U1F16_19285 [Turneriella sp.]
MKTTTHCITVGFLILLTAFSFGTIGAAEPKSEMGDYREILERPLATVQDLVDLVMMTRGDYAKFKSDEKRFAAAQQEGFIKKQKSTDTLDRGTLAFAIMKCFHVTPGWLFRLTQADRYALRDVQEAGILPARFSTANRVSGAELIGAISAAAEYQQEKETWQTKH